MIQFQKQQAIEMRKRGMTYQAIADELSVGIGRVIGATKGVTVELPLEDGEIVADAVGYDGRYRVTTHGRIFSVMKKHDVDNTKELKQHRRSSGIMRVVMRRNGVPVERSVDTVVAEAFLPERMDGYDYVRHIDGDFSNNHVDNLEWSMTDPRKEPFAFRDPAVSEADMEEIRKRWLNGESQIQLSRQYGVSATTIHKCIDGLKRDFELPRCKKGERWAKASGYDGRYYVSSHGRLFSTGCGRREPRIIKASADRDGYMCVNLIDGNGQSHSEKVHRLVAKEFCDGRSEERNVVNHIDGDPSNNKAENLEWCTLSDNTRHAADVLNAMKAGDAQTHRKSRRIIPRDENAEPSPLRRFTDEEVIAIRNDPRSSRKIAEDYGVNKCTILNIRSGITYRNI